MTIVEPRSVLQQTLTFACIAADFERNPYPEAKYPPTCAVLSRKLRNRMADYSSFEHFDLGSTQLWSNTTIVLLTMYFMVEIKSIKYDGLMIDWKIWQRSIINWSPFHSSATRRWVSWINAHVLRVDKKKPYQSTDEVDLMAWPEVGHSYFVESLTGETFGDTKRGLQHVLKSASGSLLNQSKCAS